MRRATGFTIVAMTAPLSMALLLAASGPGAAAGQGGSALRTDDFPSLDYGVWSLQRRGLAIKAADRALTEAPLDPATLDLVLEVIAWYDAHQYSAPILDSLRRLAAGDPDDVELAAQYLANNTFEIQRDESRDYRPDIAELVDAVRGRLPQLPREQAARVVRRLIPLENRLAGNLSQQSQPMVRQFVEEYAGTEAALMAEVEVIGYARDPAVEIEQLDTFIRRHPGTCAAAAAMRAKAGIVSDEPRRRRGEPREHDPTDRFLRGFELVEEIEAGTWPSCPAVDDAYQVVGGYYVGEHHVFAPDNLERLLRTYQRFVIDHAHLLDVEPRYGRGMGSVFPHRMAQLYERQGNRVGGIEQTFDLLEARATDVDGLRFTRAEFYIAEARAEESPDRPTLIRKAIDTLTAVSNGSNERYARKSLATLAALHFYERRFEPALAAYQRYLSRWPDSDWAWIARMRIGQTQEALGEWESALSSYRQAVRDYPTLPPAVVLGNVLAARASETLGRFDDALAHYIAASSGWDDDFGSRYSLDTRHAPLEEGGNDVYVADNIARADLAERIAELSASSRFAEGALLESGRRLMAQERWQDARIQLESLAYGSPSPLRADALYLAHQARFEQALELADIEAPDADQTAAYTEFDALAHEPWDPAVGAAKLARAAIMGKAGLDGDARTQTGETLQEWLTMQRGHFDAIRHDVAVDSALYADVVAIRDAVFHPLGKDFYTNDRGRWNAFDWPQQLPPFLIMNPDFSVRLADRSSPRLRVLDPLPGLDNVLFMTDEHLEFLYSILNRLGGTATRPPRAIMETPNQPIGPSVEILALWKEFFPGRPGHWGGWDLKSYPVITQIEFRNEERTEAAAAVTIGYSGCKVVLEKKDGAWIVVGLTGFWIT